MRLTIFSCNHRKPEQILSTRLFQTLVSGVEIDPLSPCMSDAGGINIAGKNDYSELRHQYYIWKNVLGSYSHVGFEHYRRPFFVDPLGLDELAARYPLLVGVRLQLFDSKAWLRQVDTRTFAQYMDMRRELDLAARRRVEDQICSYDLVVVKSQVEEIERQWKDGPDADLWDAIVEAGRDGLQRRYGTCHVNFNMTHVHWLNSYVMRIDLFADYMAFCFQALGVLERILTTPRADARPRVLGHIAERLFNFWLYQKCISDRCLRVLELPMLMHVPELD